MVHRLTVKKLKEWIADEMKGAEEYRKYGFLEQAGDEVKHAWHFENLLAEKKNDIHGS
jgi:hypothetical protein